MWFCREELGFNYRQLPPSQIGAFSTNNFLFGMLHLDQIQHLHLATPGEIRKMGGVCIIPIVWLYCFRQKPQQGAL